MRSVVARKGAWLGPLLVVPLLVGCTDRPVDKLNDRLAEKESAVGSCASSDCADQVAVLVAALETLPGVVAVNGPTYRPEQATDGASVGGELTVAPGVDCNDLEPQAAELGWQSAVSPLGSLDFDCETAPATAGAPSEDAGFLFTLVRPTSADQLKAWGDRGTLR